jgi:hypothetical protein
MEGYYKKLANLLPFGALLIRLRSHFSGSVMPLMRIDGKRAVPLRRRVIKFFYRDY